MTITTYANGMLVGAEILDHTIRPQHNVVHDFPSHVLAQCSCGGVVIGEARPQTPSRALRDIESLSHRNVDRNEKYCLARKWQYSE